MCNVSWGMRTCVSEIKIRSDVMTRKLALSESEAEVGDFLNPTYSNMYM